MRFVATVSATLILAYALVARARPVSQPEFRPSPSGSVRYVMADTLTLVSTGADTTTGVFVAGCDQWSYYVLYDAQNDSTNLKLYIDLSSAGKSYVSWQTAAYDSALVSGATDTEWFRNITNPPNHAMLARGRIKGAMVAGDTVKVTIHWVLNWLPQAINP